MIKESSTSGLATLKQIKCWLCEVMNRLLLEEMGIETSFPIGYPIQGQTKKVRENHIFWNTLSECESEREATEFE